MTPQTRNLDILAVVLGIIVILFIVWFVRPNSALSSSPSGSMTTAASGEAVDPPRLQGPTIQLGTAIESGSIGYAVPSLGSSYLALPEGPGSRVEICYRSNCIVRVSTDAGPALSEQRKGRIGDLAFASFRDLCGCDPQIVGRIRVSIERLGAGPRITLPPTDTEP